MAENKGGKFSVDKVVQVIKTKKDLQVLIGIAVVVGGLAGFQALKSGPEKAPTFNQPPPVAAKQPPANKPHWTPPKNRPHKEAKHGQAKTATAKAHGAEKKTPATPTTARNAKPAAKPATNTAAKSGKTVNPAELVARLEKKAAQKPAAQKPVAKPAARPAPKPAERPARPAKPAKVAGGIPTTSAFNHKRLPGGNLNLLEVDRRPEPAGLVVAEKFAGNNPFALFYIEKIDKLIEQKKKELAQLEKKEAELQAALLQIQTQITQAVQRGMQVKKKLLEELKITKKGKKKITVLPPIKVMGISCINNRCSATTNFGVITAGDKLPDGEVVKEVTPHYIRTDKRVIPF